MAGKTKDMSPVEVARALRNAADPAKPTLDLATLEGYAEEWSFPRSLDYWEGYVYADLLEQLGWALCRHEEYEEALEVWRRCPWPAVVEGERQALAHIITEAYEQKTLVLGPAVGDLIATRELQLGQVLSTLDDPAAALYRSSSGDGFVVETLLVQPGGAYHLRFEFDTSTLFYMSFVPLEVHNKLLLARANFRMGEAKETARYLLQAAFLAHNAGHSQEAFSFLEKARQMDPASEQVKSSLQALTKNSVAPTLYSRVLVERSLFQPDPLSRCEIKPTEPPQPQSFWASSDWRDKLPAGAVKGQVEGKIVSMGVMPTDKARETAGEIARGAQAWPLLLPASWRLPPLLDHKKLEIAYSRARGYGLEKLGRWKGDYRKALEDLVEAWPCFDSRAAEPEVLEFALPKESQLCVFGCQEAWQIPLLLNLELGELGGREVLAAWLRRLAREWGCRPLLFADDVIWFQVAELPEENRRELFLADLMSFSSDVAECFEPAMIRPCSEHGPYLFPVPMQLALA